MFKYYLGFLVNNYFPSLNKKAGVVIWLVFYHTCQHSQVVIEIALFLSFKKGTDKLSHKSRQSGIIQLEIKH